MPFPINDAQSFESWARALTAATVGGVIGSIVLAGSKSPLLAFAFGNSTQSWFLDNVWDVYMGADFRVFESVSKEDIKMVLKSNSSLANTAHDADARVWFSQFFNASNTDTNVEFKFQSNKAKFIYNVRNKDIPEIIYGSDSVSFSDLKEIMKLFPKNLLPAINGQAVKFNFLHDYYNGNGINESTMRTAEWLHRKTNGKYRRRGCNAC